MDVTYLSPKELSLRTIDGHIFLNSSEIVRFEADRNYTLLYLLNQALPERLSCSFSDIEKRLKTNKQFYKCHRSHIVNLTYIKKFKDKAHYLQTEHGEVPVSESYLHDFKELFCKPHIY